MLFRSRRRARGREARTRNARLTTLAPIEQPGRSAADHGEEMKVRDVIRLIENAGWRQVRQRGSHRQFTHPARPGLVTVPGSPSADLAAGTLASVLRQAGLKP